MYKMYPEAYKEWIKIFGDDVLEVWQKERKELQKASMLFYALQKELKDVQTSVEVELINIRQQLKHKDLLEERKKSLSPHCRRKKKSSPNSVNKENDCKLKLDVSSALSIPDKLVEKESPDLFKNLDLNAQSSSPDSSVIDLSLSDEDVTKVDGSPTIKRRRKHHDRYKPRIALNVNTDSKKALNTPKKKSENLIKANLFKTPALKSDDDFSVIENTPEVKSRSSNTATKSRGSMSKKSLQSRNTTNTLTQMYSKLLPNKDPENDVDSDETYCEDSDGSKMGITDMLSYINKDESLMSKEKTSIDNRIDDLGHCDLDMDSSSQELDQFSKGAIFNEADVATSSEKPKVVPLEPEVVVRGKARKQLQGWACEKCKNFYGQMKLSPEELKKKMDECSRHRYKYRPPEETLPGFWDLSIPPEKPL